MWRGCQTIQGRRRKRNDLGTNYIYNTIDRIKLREYFVWTIILEQSTTSLPSFSPAERSKYLRNSKSDPLLILDFHLSCLFAMIYGAHHSLHAGTICSLLHLLPIAMPSQTRQSKHLLECSTIRSTLPDLLPLQTHSFFGGLLLLDRTFLQALPLKVATDFLQHNCLQGIFRVKFRVLHFYCPADWFDINHRKWMQKYWWFWRLYRRWESRLRRMRKRG